MTLFAIIVLLALVGFFAGSEIAFVVANRLRVEVAARRGGFVSEVVRDFMQEPAKFLTTTLVGTNIALVGYSTLMTFYLNAPLEQFFSVTAGFAEAGTYLSVLLVQTLIASLVVLILGEILPKSLMREVANQAVFVLAVPLRVSYYLLLPLVKLAGWSASGLVKLLRSDAETFSQFMRHDFEIVIRESRESGLLDLDEEESELLSNVFALSSIRVRDSMIPRTDIVAVDENTTLEALRQKFIETGHSRLPVYRENIDNIVGIVFAFDLFSAPESLAEIIRPTKFVPESKLSKELLRDLLTANSSVAIVIDEYGGTAGLVTREDLLEELFGDIRDEFDAESELLRQVGEDTFIASGRVRLDELEERFGITLPPGDYDTVAGYLLEKHGAIPNPRDEFEFDGCRFTVVKSITNRIDLVRLVRLPGGE